MPNRKCDVKLSPREKEVTKYAWKGLLSKQIAEKLLLSKHTVDVHRKHILKKTKTSNFFELMRKFPDILS